MLSVRHDGFKAGQTQASLSPPTQLAAARLGRQASEAVRARLLPPASAQTASALIIAFPTAGRCAIPMPAGVAGWLEKPVRNVADASHRWHPVPFQAKPAETATCFSISDRIALLEWSSQGSSGYARIVLEEGVPGATPDRSAYVLLYRHHDPFATLGITRHAGHILVWRGSDGTGCGIYATMAAALAGLPPAPEVS
ncbi:MAG TPA: hypothetical protein VGC15_17835 [Acetobacteraceae bacterium]